MQLNESQRRSSRQREGEKQDKWPAPPPDTALDTPFRITDAIFQKRAGDRQQVATREEIIHDDTASTTEREEKDPFWKSLKLSRDTSSALLTSVAASSVVFALTFASMGPRAIMLPGGALSCCMYLSMSRRDKWPLTALSVLSGVCTHFVLSSIAQLFL